MAFPLLFIVLPFILNEEINNKLPKYKDTNSLNWIDNINRETFIEIPNLCHNLAPYTREAVILGMQQQFLIINNNGLIKSNKSIQKLNNISEYRKNARVLGCLLAKITPEAIFMKLGFTP